MPRCTIATERRRKCLCRVIVDETVLHEWQVQSMDNRVVRAVVAKFDRKSLSARAAKR